MGVTCYVPLKQLRVTNKPYNFIYIFIDQSFLNLNGPQLPKKCLLGVFGGEENNVFCVTLELKMEGYSWFAVFILFCL